MHEGTVDPSLDSGAWMTLAEAARALGISEKTARRRAHAGQFDARQVPTRHGPTWQVRLPDGVPTVDRVDSGDTQAAAMLELVRLVGELHRRVPDLWAASQNGVHSGVGRALAVRRHARHRRDRAGHRAVAATQDGLVNVYLNDVEIAKDVNVAAVVGVVANVCPNVNADVAALAALVDQSDAPQSIDCQATGDTVTLKQNEISRW